MNGLAFAFWVATATAAGGDRDLLDVTLMVRPVVLDYGLPGHPNTEGISHVGIIASSKLIWMPHRAVDLEFGVLGRIPFALADDGEFVAAPLLALVARPFGNSLTLRLGTLDDAHGYHPALVDRRALYGRDIQRAYNRSLVREAHRDLGQALKAPVEYGSQILFQLAGFWADIFLDWQLVETDEHREKFNFGALFGFSHRYIDASLQFRLTHYGGESFTSGDPLRRSGLDPVRQPESFAINLVGHVLDIESVKLDLSASFVAGQMKQTPGVEERWHYGTEVGAKMHLFDLGVVEYRFWAPRGGLAGFVSEDGDPIFRAGRSHRVVLGIEQAFAGLSVQGGVDIIFAEGLPQIQYIARTVATYRFRAGLL